MNTRLGLHLVSRSNRFSRAQFSPLRHAHTRIAGHAPASPVALPRLARAHAARDFAQRAFLSHWAHPALLDRAQPVLTRYRD